MNKPIAPKYHRQKFLLLLLQQAGGCLSKMDLQKLLLLSLRQSGLKYYEFVPYMYGCYSFQATADLEVLEDKQWIRQTKNTIKLINNPQFDYSFDEIEATRVSVENGKNRGEALIKTVYRNYPYYAIKSRMAERISDKKTLKKINGIRDKYKSSVTKLFTIGYEGISFEAYLNTLIRNDIKILCDVRKNPLSRKFGFSKTILAKTIPKLDVEYCHIPELGIVAEKRAHLETESDYQTLFNNYKQTLPEYENKILLINNLLASRKRVALTCFEKQPEFCHRHCISDYLEKNYYIKVKHL